jgi:hypothetical protein
MKKGCFLSVITILTLLTMLGIYLFRNHKDFFKKIGKEKLLSFVSNSMDEKLSKLENNPYKDSLKVLLQKEIKFVKETKLDEGMREFGYVIDRVKEYSRDGKIDSTEFVNLKNMVIENEKSEKN